jgi:catechol 2,3-dioxygenase
MGVKELGHVVLYVRDAMKSADFYRDVLGFHQTMAPDEGAFRAAAFSSDRTHHELLLIEVGNDATPVPSGRRLGMYHFGLKIGDTDDELRAMLTWLQESGTPIVGASDHGFTHSLYILDPDGNEIELYIDVQGVDWKDRSIMAQAAKPLRI